MLPCTGTDIHDMVCFPHSVLVVLHHNDGIAQVPQVLQGTEQLVVVPLVEPDAGLVQDVGHAHQTGADLGGQAYPLGLPAGERAGGSRQSQIIQPHIHEKLDPCPDFLQDLSAYQRLLVRQLQILQEFLQFFHREGRDLGNVHASHRHCEGGLLQPLAAAFMAGRDAHKRLVLGLCHFGPGLSVAPLHAPDQPLKGHVIDALSTLAPVMHLHLFPVGAVDEYIVYLLRIIFKGCAQRKFVFSGQRLQDSPGVAPPVRTGLPAQDDDGPLVDAQGFVRDHQVLVKLHLVAQSVALRAGPEGVVEGKAPGLYLVNADAAVRAGKALAEIHRLPAYHIHHKKPLRQVEHTFHGIGKALLNARLYHKPVHDDLDIVLDIFVQRDVL